MKSIVADGLEKILPSASVVFFPPTFIPEKRSSLPAHRHLLNPRLVIL